MEKDEDEDENEDGDGIGSGRQLPAKSAFNRTELII